MGMITEYDHLKPLKVPARSQVSYNMTLHSSGLEKAEYTEALLRTTQFLYSNCFILLKLMLNEIKYLQRLSHPASCFPL